MFLFHYDLSLPLFFSTLTYRIAGNFRGRKLSRISRFSRHPPKFSLRNSRHATPIMRPILTFRESFLREMLLSYRSAKVFSLENFPLYGTFSFSSLSVSLSPPQLPSQQPLLIDVFGGPPAPPPAAAAEVTTPPTATGLSPGAEEGYMRFLLKNNGVLFENEMLQIGVKSEYKKI